MQGKKLTTVVLAALVGYAGLTATMAVAASASSTGTTPGHDDSSGYQIVRLANATVPNFARRTVRCPPGKRVVGGGAEAQGNDAILLGSYPTEDGSGWTGLGRQYRYGDVGISVYAVCVYDV